MADRVKPETTDELLQQVIALLKKLLGETVAVKGQVRKGRRKSR